MFSLGHVGTFQFMIAPAPMAVSGVGVPAWCVRALKEPKQDKEDVHDVPSMIPLDVPMPMKHAGVDVNLTRRYLVFNPNFEPSEDPDSVIELTRHPSPEEACALRVCVCCIHVKCVSYKQRVLNGCALLLGSPTINMLCAIGSQVKLRPRSSGQQFRWTRSQGGLVDDESDEPEKPNKRDARHPLS